MSDFGQARDGSRSQTWLLIIAGVVVGITLGAAVWGIGSVRGREAQEASASAPASAALELPVAAERAEAPAWPVAEWLARAGGFRTSIGSVVRSAMDRFGSAFGVAAMLGKAIGGVAELAMVGPGVGDEVLERGVAGGGGVTPVSAATPVARRVRIGAEPAWVPRSARAPVGARMVIVEVTCEASAVVRSPQPPLPG
ncbi:MAG: hypothetical protein KF745_00460 [Phycisphaeraceae bacterium]|nr:hypothetical protein [Phycisphaeraceae bacterium]